jgi:hypothetical protein
MVSPIVIELATGMLLVCRAAEPHHRLQELDFLIDLSGRHGI